MPIDRDLWTFDILKDHVPAWPCPGCGVPTLKVVAGTFQTIKDRESELIPDHEYHPTMVTGRFVCLLHCWRCKESSAVSGNFTTGQDSEFEFECGRPTSITPPPPMTQVPKKSPRAIKREMTASFSAYWSDLPGSLNHIRQALELLLDDVGIPRTTVNKKRTHLPLHSRIEILKARKPKLEELCERMMAVKHLGNAGSHSKDIVKKEDVFDGFDILERVLNDTYSDHEGVLAKMVSQINKRKGPRKSGI